jgi:anti-sigma-K factor RskA
MNPPRYGAGCPAEVYSRMVLKMRLVDKRAAKDDEAAFWRSKTPEERVAAVEFLRLQCLYASGLTEMPKLARVARLVDKRA